MLSFFIVGGSGFTFGSPAPTTTLVAPGGISLASSTTNATSSRLTEGLTLSKTSASTGTSNTGFTFLWGLDQPTGLSGSICGTPNTQASILTLESAPSQSFTPGAGKLTAPAMINPTSAFTPRGATAASSASTGITPGTTGTSISPGFSFPVALGGKHGLTQTITLLSTATTTGWYFV